MARLRSLPAFLLLLVLASCVPQPGAPVTVTVSLALRQTRLENGLSVILNPDAAATSALVQVRYYVGAKDEPVGRAGFANLVEHLTFEPEAPDGKANRRASLERIGAVDMSGWATNDFTEFSATVPPSFLASALSIEASRMAHPLDGIDDAAVRTELALIANERGSRARSDEYGLARALIEEALFGDAHPYARPGSRRPHELDDVTVAELQAFASIHYRPSNAALVVSGRFDADEASRLIARAFGRIRGRPAPPRQLLPAPRLATDQRATYGAPVRRRVVAMGWLCPAPETDGYDELMLARHVMEGLMREGLITTLPLVDDVRVDVRAGHLGSSLVVAATPRAGVSADRTIAEMERVLSFVASLGRTYEWDQFAEVRLALGTSAIIEREALATRASRIQNDLEYRETVRSPAEDFARLQRLQPWDVGGAVKQFIVDAHRAVVVLEPDEAAPSQGARR